MVRLITKSGQFLRTFAAELAVFDVREVFFITLAVGGLLFYAYMSGG